MRTRVGAGITPAEVGPIPWHESASEGDARGPTNGARRVPRRQRSGRMNRMRPARFSHAFGSKSLTRRDAMHCRKHANEGVTRTTDRPGGGAYLYLRAFRPPALRRSDRFRRSCERRAMRLRASSGLTQPTKFGTAQRSPMMSTILGLLSEMAIQRLISQTTL
jgi:hypothetical protein